MDVARVEAEAQDSPVERNRAFALQYLASDGRDIEHPMKDQIILLYTVGRRSAVIRRIPLASFQADDDLLVVGSKGGAPTHPDWFYNIVANPRVWVRKGAHAYEARARVLGGQERAKHWDRIVENHPAFGRYQDTSGRELPVVRITET